MCNRSVFGLVVHNCGVCGLAVLNCDVCRLAVLNRGVFGLMVFNRRAFGLMVLNCGVLGFVISDCCALNRRVRLPVIGRVALVRVTTSLVLMHPLPIRCLYMIFMHGCLFRGRRSRIDSARPVEADVIVNDRIVIDHIAVNIGVVDNRRIHSPNRGIIVKGTALPSAATEPPSKIAVAIVDAAVVSDVGPPITGVPPIEAASITPVARSPKQSRFWRFNPVAGNPVITLVCVVSPVTGNPEIPIVRTRWLLVDNERGRRNRDRLSEKRGCYAQQKSQ